MFYRSEAFDEEDCIKAAICDSKSTTENINGSGGCEALCDLNIASCPGLDGNEGHSDLKMTSEQATSIGGTTTGKPGKMISSFVTVIEDTKDLSLHEEKQRSPQRPRPQPAAPATSTMASKISEDELLIDTAEGPVPVPAKCSAQLRRLLQSHSITRPALNGGCSVASGSSNENSIAEPRRPIYPNLPYSPYSSPASSPRVRRKPLRETTRVNSTVQSDGEYVQLNQYKLEQAIGQVHTYKPRGKSLLESWSTPFLPD